MRTFSKIVVSTVASMMFATSAFATCGCDLKGDIPFGQDVVIGGGKTKAVKTAKAPKRAPVSKVAIAKPAAAALAGGNLNCLAGGNSGSWTLHWVRGGNGRCPGQIRASDASILVNMANDGITSFRIAFYIPEKCPKSQWASMPATADIRTHTISLRPWDKVCTENGHFKPYAK